MAIALALALHLLSLAASSDAAGPAAGAAAPPGEPAAAELASLPAPEPPPPGLAAAPSTALAMTLAPRELEQPGPLRTGEVAAAALGAFTGDALVLGGGLLALRLFSNGTIAPTAGNFRHAVYGLGASALVLPPLAAVGLAALVGRGHAPFGFWKAMLLATAGQVAALATGYLAAPRFWVIVPVQALAVSLGTSFGLHWGSRAPAADPRAAPPGAAPGEQREAAGPRPGATALVAVPLCPAG
jgi:hypothetical protein